jgi:hypothetical protein
MNKITNQIVDILCGITLGFILGCWFYCHQLGITSGPLYLEPIAAVLAALSAIACKAITHLDSSFNR